MKTKSKQKPSPPGHKHSRRDSHQKTWDECYALLKSVCRQTGDANVSDKLVVDGKHIGRWVHGQRRLHRLGRLPNEQAALLEEIGLEWNLQGDAWDKRCDLLQRHILGTGNADIADDLLIGQFNMGAWVKAQRSLYERGELSQKRTARLLATGLPLPKPRMNKPKAPRNAKTKSPPGKHGLARKPQAARKPRATKEVQDPPTWDEQFALAKRVMKDTGSNQIRRHLVVDGVAIGQWASRQRQKYHRGTLLAARKAKLEKAGFAWSNESVLMTEHWDERFALLKRAMKDIGSNQVSRRLVVDGVQIGRWACRQRQYYRNGTLPAERKAKLEGIGFAWTNDSSREAEHWDERFVLLKRAMKQTGNGHVHRNLVVDGIAIGRWASRQRQKYHNGTLLAARKAKLEKAGFAWSVERVPPPARLHQDSWDQVFSILERFVLENGINSIKKSTVIDGHRVGYWYSRQKGKYKKGALLPERAARLKTLGVQWIGNEVGPTDGSTWSDHCNLLEAIWRCTGNANIDTHLIVEGCKLGQWCNEQRALRQQGKLATQDIARLDAIGFKWDLDAQGQTVNPSHVKNGANGASAGQPRVKFFAGLTQMGRRFTRQLWFNRAST